MSSSTSLAPDSDVFVNSATSLSISNRRIMQSSQLCCATGKYDLLPRDTNVHRLVSSSQVQPHLDNMMEVNLNLIDQATAFGATDAPQVTAVVKKKRNPCKSLSLKLGAWNVRTTNDSDGSIRPERATAIICKELDKAAMMLSTFVR